MIQPETFYQPDEFPGKNTTSRMWNTIQHDIHHRKITLFFIADRQSFFYGIAAAFMLYFVSVGVYTTIRQSVENTKPKEMRLDEAYQSAIEDFEKIVPQVTGNTITSDRDKQYLEARKVQLDKIDTAIENFKQEIGGGDYSPLVQQRLRQLYSMKLNVLQELIDKGEKEL